MPRLFFALWPTDEQRLAMANATQAAVRSSQGRAVPIGNLHVTLAFIGSVSEAQIPAIVNVAGAIVAAPVQLTFDRTEYWSRSGVLCATAATSSASSHEPVPAPDVIVADVLAAALKSNLVAAGFTPDLKPFRTHVTLARKVSHGSGEFAMQSVHWHSNSFALVASQTQPAGSLYSVLQSWLLYENTRENQRKKLE